ncbi:MAG: hypothetical protein E6K97_01285 [Thaumarchaeota archaeon]|nr:MAG: hypothetical protein E6K97_01285 [Nitrososphaerota archaeon]
MKSLILLSIILTATFVAGSIDIIFPDVIPIRPYTYFSIGLINFNNTSQQFSTYLFQLVLMLTVSLLLIHFNIPLPLIPLGHRSGQFRRGKRIQYTSKSSLQFSQFNKTLVKKIKETPKGKSAESRLDRVVNEGKARFKTRRPTKVDEYEKLLEEAKKRDESE